MDIAVKRGFAIGFVVVAGLAALYGCEPELRRAMQSLRGEAPSTRLVIPVEPAPKSSAPSSPDAATPTPAAPPAPSASGSASPSPAEPPAVATPPAQDQASTAAPQTPAAKEIPAAAPPPPAADASKGGAFDIVRVEPSGEMVVAGRCAANCEAELLANGKRHDGAKADAQGQWAMTPGPLPPGDYQLSLRTKAPDGTTRTSDQTLTVAVPTPPSKDVVVVLNAPDAPSRILQKPESKVATAPSAPAAETPPAAPSVAERPAAPSQAKSAASTARLAIAAVEAENGRFYAQGSGPTEARLRLYLNNAPLASATIGADERWSLRVERGLAPGAYVVRADQLDPASSKVVARVETNFTYAPQVAAVEPAPSKSVSAPPPSAPAASAEPSAATPQSQPEVLSRPAAKTPEAAAPRTDSPPVSASEATAAAGAETPTHAEPPSVATAAPADAANPVVASIDTAQVRRGDSLWRISRSTYGRGVRYTVIYEANDEQIRNPNLIYPGQVLVLPADGAEASGTPAKP